MNITYTSVRYPEWVNAERTAIKCIVKFRHMKKEGEFIASATYDLLHGRQIFAECVQGLHGEIGVFQPQPTLPVPDIKSSNTPHVDAGPGSWPGWPQASDFLTEANAENARGTPRGIILVWASMVEEMLGDILEAFLIDHSLSLDLIWDDAHSPLKSFSGRVTVAFALGLISKKEHRACDSIRTIRNVAAHKWKVSFENPEFKKRALPAFKRLHEDFSKDVFEFYEDLEFLVTLIYGGACGMLVSALANRQMEASKEQRTIKMNSGGAASSSTTSG